MWNSVRVWLSALWIAAVVLLGAPLCIPVAVGQGSNVEPGLDEETLSGLEFRSIGPALTSGRIADIAVNPHNRHIWYVAVGSGGVWKTENGGATWESIFDSEGSYSIGVVTIDPNRPDTIWVGTGEHVAGRHVGYGDGVYRSMDGGETWSRMGLEKSNHIGALLVDPRDSATVYVAAQGPLWSAGGDRGLYKTSDGGVSWNKILGDGPYTGVNEVIMDPRDPDVLYASTWQRFRNVAALMDGGPNSGIYKSVDGGASWRELSEGLPKEDKGKIGLAVSPQRPDVVYATIELGGHGNGGFWRSDNGGETWEKRSDFVPSGTGPHYYQRIFASPHKFDLIYQMDVFLQVSTDGGKEFEKKDFRDKHPDHHAMAFVPEDPNYLIVGTDGGLYESFDGGESWRFVNNLPVTQFYRITVDYDEPFYNIYGGTQDNGTMGVPSRTDSMSGILNSDWFIAFPGDGHQPRADPTNPDIIYVQAQMGNLSRFDRRTGETVFIQPQPARGELSERFNWDAPVIISPHDPKRLYFASQRVWRSDNRGHSWTAISNDLSRGQDRLRIPLIGRIWSFDAVWDLRAMSVYGTITALSESPVVEGLLYVGTDDGVIQISEDGGRNWRKVTKLPSVPNSFFVNDIKADQFDPDAVYVLIDRHKFGDYSPYVLKSEDRGRSWKNISDGIPERHIVWRMVQDHVNPDLLFIGTEFGVFYSSDGGGAWVKLDGGIPNIAVRDLVIQRRENDLVAGTFGRGIYILDDYSPLRELDSELLAEEIVLFPPRDALWYVPRAQLGCRIENCKARQGANFFQAPNPPFGAVFTYYLREDILTKKEERRKSEKKLEKTGEDTPFPGWAEIIEEVLEDPPAIVLTIKDSEGNVVRHIEGESTAGFRRIAWDLRYPYLGPWEAEGSSTNPVGALVAPGTYMVSLGTRVNGELHVASQEKAFEVISIREPTLAGSTQSARVEFSRNVDELIRSAAGAVAAINNLIEEVALIKEMLVRSTADYLSLYQEAVDIEQRAKRMRDRFVTNTLREPMGDFGSVTIMSRLMAANPEAGWYSTGTSAHGPTATHRASLNIATAEFTEVRRSLDELINVDYARLKTRLEESGVPWSRGRPVPTGN